MRIRLRGAFISLDEQLQNDRSFRPSVVLAFLAVIAVYCYLFTHVPIYLGLPMPEELFGGAPESIGYEFDDDGNVDSRLYIQTADRFTNDDERMILFGVITGAFFCGYFLPLRSKKPSFVLWFLIGFCALYGTQPTVLLCTAHLGIYLCLHGPHRRSAAPAILFGVLLYGTFAIGAVGPAVFLWGATASGLASLAVCRWALFPLLARDCRLVRLVQSLTAYLPMLIVYLGIAANGLLGREWAFSFGWFFFLFQWARLIVYHVDYKYGEVPRDLGLFEYLSLFLSPAVIPNYSYGPYLAPGYSYLTSNYLCREKNEIITGGLNLWAIALGYLVFANWAVDTFAASVKGALGIPVYAYISQMVDDYVDGTPMSTPTVLISTMLDQANVFLLWGAVLHFKVGTWRVLGYQVDPQYNRPWLATNLATLWGRFAFHYREFLVRAVYFPVFFRVFKKKAVLRVFTAIMVATIIGNPFWGHTPAKLLASGLTWGNFYGVVLRSWPYYVLLGLGISLAQIYLMRRVRTRKPWTRDRRFFLDILCAYLTFQYFSLIHIFIRPRSGSELMDHVRLFLIGLGIHI